VLHLVGPVSQWIIKRKSKVLYNKTDDPCKTMKPNWIKSGQMLVSPPRCEKAGIIPYIRTNNGIWICLGLSNGILTDFSGDKSMFDLTSIDTALKRCRSASLSVFDFSIHDLEIMSPLYVYDKNKLTLFIDITNWGFEIDYYIELYETRKSVAKSCQYEELVWLSSEKITEIISKKLRNVDSELRSHIRDISKNIPGMYYHPFIQVC
jgi:hypothetical protein